MRNVSEVLSKMDELGIKYTKDEDDVRDNIIFGSYTIDPTSVSKETMAAFYREFSEELENNI